MTTPTFDTTGFFNTKQIGGRNYTIQALAGWDAWKGWTLILETVAPVFGEVLDSRAVDQDVAMFEKQNTFREILSIVASNVHKEEVNMLIGKMLSGATCDDKTIDIDSHFRAKAHEMMELIVFALEVNFKGFFTQSDMFQSIMGGLGKVMSVTESE